MTLRLTFRAGVMDGVGSDFVGDFSMKGSYAADSGEVKIRKRYAAHTVWYSGRWDGQMIAGTWQLGRQSWKTSGPFEIWPESEETTLEQLHETEPEVAALPQPTLSL
jgi:hypothetical protein